MGVEIGEFQCAICLELITDNRICSVCQARYCKDCITQTVKMSNKNQCPCCKQEASFNHDKLFQQLVNKVDTLCELCNFTIPHGDIVEHNAKYCEKKPVVCKMDEFGCEWKGVNEQKQEHEQYCPYVTVQSGFLKLKVELQNRDSKIIDLENEIQKLQDEKKLLETKITAQDDTEMRRYEVLPTAPISNQSKYYMLVASSDNYAFTFSRKPVDQQFKYYGMFKYAQPSLVNAIGNINGHVYTACEDGYIRLWDVKKSRNLATVLNCEGVPQIKATSVDTRIITVGKDHLIRILNIASASSLKPSLLQMKPQIEIDQVTSLIADYNDLYVGWSFSNCVELYDSNTLELKSTIGLKGTYPTCMTSIPLASGSSGRENILAVGSADGGLELIDARTCTPHSITHVHTDLITAMCMKDARLYTCSHDRSIRVIDLRMPKVLAQQIAHDKWVQCIIPHPLRDNTVFTGSSDNTIKQWKLKGEQFETAYPIDTKLDVQCLTAITL
jgi:hypothetical protein